MGRMVNITFYKRKRKHFRYCINQEEKLHANNRNDKKIADLEKKIIDCNMRIREKQKENKRKRG